MKNRPLMLTQCLSRLFSIRIYIDFMQGSNMKSLTIIWLTCLVGTVFADEKQSIQPIINEPIEIVLVCPEGSKYQGEKVPEWVTTSAATEFFCNEASEETEIAE